MDVGGDCWGSMRDQQAGVALKIPHHPSDWSDFSGLCSLCGGSIALKFSPSVSGGAEWIFGEALSPLGDDVGGPFCGLVHCSNKVCLNRGALAFGLEKGPLSGFFCVDVELFRLILWARLRTKAARGTWAEVSVVGRAMCRRQ